MRILQGLYKSRELKTPKGKKTRPTTAIVRKSVFDILRHQIEHADFLDLFAGSGSMGIEALSRGAKTATFVEQDRAAAGCIRENLRALDAKGTVFQTPVLAAIKRLSVHGSTFDIIYMDPPYDLDIGSILNLIPSLLSPNGIVLIEQSKKTTLHSTTLTKIDERHFSDTSLHFFTHR